MGVDTRRPILPAPTESSTLESNVEVEEPVLHDTVTDLSRVTDRTSYTIPDDGRPITISTHRKEKGLGKLARPGHQSQTSLLIEYFEAGKDTADVKSRPSIRVKVTPSSKSRKAKDQRDHLLVTETTGNRKPSVTRRISLGTSDSALAEQNSNHSLDLNTDSPTNRRREPRVEVELLDRSDVSGSSVSRDARYIVPGSDISSMPPDSMLESATGEATRPLRSRSVSREDVVEKDTLKAPRRQRSRSLSRERLVTQKVMEKLAQKPHISSPSGKHHRASRSVSREALEDGVKSPARRRLREDESVTTGAESNVTGNSYLSANRKSGDAYSFRSGTSKSSINNPKLLETVEDAIRRLILPELKELKKDQRVEKNRKVFDGDTESSVVSTSATSRDEPRRRVSKHSSHTGSKSRREHRSSKDSEDILSSGGRRRRRRKDYDYDSPSERSYGRRESGDSTMIEDERTRRKRREHKLRDAAAGALVGGALTAAALKHHDSRSSVDSTKRERRKKRSKSRSSRSASIAETEEIFNRHDVPAMPMRSEVDSELTRSSLLSEQTSSTMTPIQKELRNVTKASPVEMRSPTARSPAASTPTRSSASLQKGLGMHHDNISRGDLSGNSRKESETSTQSPVKSLDETHEDSYGYGAAALAGVAGGFAAGHLLDDYERERRYEQNLHHQHPIRRGLSPIQSVASYREDISEPARHSVMYSQSAGSSTSLDRRDRARSAHSFETLSSENSVDLAKKRHAGISLESRSEVMGQHPDQRQRPVDERSVDEWYDEQHRENDRYRDSYLGSDADFDTRQTATLTDDSHSARDSDNTGAGHQVARGAANIPAFIHSPDGVESAVASLYEPSMVGAKSVGSFHGSFAEGLDREALSPKPLNYTPREDKGSPLKHTFEPESDKRSFQERALAASPIQSVPGSISEKESIPQMGTSGIPVPNDPMPEINHGLESPESEITTNPSVIQGPMPQENGNSWRYDRTPTGTKDALLSPRSEGHGISATKAALAGAALGAGLAGAAAAAHNLGQGKDRVEAYNETYDPQLAKDPNRLSYMTGQTASSPGPDEGYISGKPPTTGALTPDLKTKDRVIAAEDPFPVNNRHAGGLSHGMASPLYDGATGQGMDRIQSKDIVALMDHLTVRDAQRNARDTEILVTLVRTAAEMRNSFQDMKRFIADENEYIMDTADVQHDKTVKRVIGGPRPQPSAAPRFQRQYSSEPGEDITAKRQNVFKRALKGLSAKNNTELQNIEAMLTQLLDEVEGLRAVQEGRPPRSSANDLASVDRLHGNVDEGYEADGATTSAGGDRSGFLSQNSSHQGFPARRPQENYNRVSTVMEGDEDIETFQPREQEIIEQLTTDEGNLGSPVKMGENAPFSTPPRKPVPVSYENTPRMSIDNKSRKHKSDSSSFMPKISRWSKTTASSVADALRGKKDRPYSHASQSGSDLGGEYEYEHSPDDRLRSNTSLEGRENRPPSPLIPSQLSEHPKYQAHRNSLNLQHPQPRQGPTGRYQHHLETQADTYGPESPTASEAEHWATLGASEPRMLPGGMDGSGHRTMGNGAHDRMSPLSDVYSESSSAMMELGEEEARRSAASSSNQSVSGAPPRPPKLRDNTTGPLVPDRPPKIAMSPGPGARQPTYIDHVAAQRGSSLSPAGASPTRKPSGPRPIISSGQYSPGRGANGEGGHLADIKKHRYRKSPNHIDSSTESLDY